MQPYCLTNIRSTERRKRASIRKVVSREIVCEVLTSFSAATLCLESTCEAIRWCLGLRFYSLQFAIRVNTETRWDKSFDGTRCLRSVVLHVDFHFVHIFHIGRPLHWVDARLHTSVEKGNDRIMAHISNFSSVTFLGHYGIKIYILGSSPPHDVKSQTCQD